MMPVMDGLTFLARCKSSPHSPGLCAAGSTLSRAEARSMPVLWRKYSRLQRQTARPSNYVCQDDRFGGATSGMPCSLRLRRVSSTARVAPSMRW